MWVPKSECVYRSEKSIFIKTWKNRTNELQLDVTIYQDLVKWFQRSGSFTITKSRDNADFILAGEIVSIDLPSRSYTANNTTKEVKIKLTVRYILKEIATNKVVIEVPSKVLTEEYYIGATTSETTDNEQEALETIINDLSQKIYRNAIREIPRL